MTSSAPRPKWTVHLALLLICQTARLIEGYPRASLSNTIAKVSPNASNSSVLRLIEDTYKYHELLRPQQWSINGDNPGIEQTQWDSLKRESSNDVQDRRKKSLQESDVTMHRNSDEIVFPGSMLVPTPLPCRNSTFCENVNNYPRELIKTMIARDAKFGFLENVDVISDVEQRIDFPDESPLCQYREQVIYPQSAQNKEKQWLFIVNQENVKQGIRIEACVNEDQECNMFKNVLSSSYKTSCKQKYIYRELVAMGSDGSITKDQFRFPSSCCCHTKFVGDPAVRLAASLDLTERNISRPSDFPTLRMLR